MNKTRKTTSARMVWITLACGSGLCAVGAAVLHVHSGYRAVPSPPGMVMRIELPGVAHGMGGFFVTPHTSSIPAIRVTDTHVPTAAGTHGVFYSYPGGKRLFMADLFPEGGEAPDTRLFDFNGDGVEDRVTDDEVSGDVQVRVLSGLNGEVLYDFLDPREYDWPQRGYPLGDLDGDGFGELAISHQRMDRSKHDWVVTDALLGARSWVTVVSGARLFDVE